MPFLFSLPSALLTLDIILEEVDSAPMDDGALLCALVVNRCREDLDFFFAYDMFHFWNICYCDNPWYKGNAYRIYPAYGRYDCMTGMWVQDIILDVAGVTDMRPRVVSQFSRLVPS